MIIKKKKRLYPPKWHRFPKRLQGGAIFLFHLFSQCDIIKCNFKFNLCRADCFYCVDVLILKT